MRLLADAERQCGCAIGYVTMPRDRFESFTIIELDPRYHDRVMNEEERRQAVTDDMATLNRERNRKWKLGTAMIFVAVVSFCLFAWDSKWLGLAGIALCVAISFYHDAIQTELRAIRQSGPLADMLLRRSEHAYYSFDEWSDDEANTPARLDNAWDHGHELIAVAYAGTPGRFRYFFRKLPGRHSVERVNQAIEALRAASPEEMAKLDARYAAVADFRDNNRTQ